MTKPSIGEIESRYARLETSPRDAGSIELIVIRPGPGERKELEEGLISRVHGLQGDSWRERGSHHTPDGAAHKDQQITLMNSRIISILTETKNEWKKAGDQLYVDLDLSIANLPEGSRLEAGTAILEISGMKHVAQRKFAEYFGKDAARFVNSPLGREGRFRGVKCSIVRDGIITRGDIIRKID